MIRPILFVGVGTTGTKILKYLRRLMFEEYERAGLPIFRYVAIETDGSEDGEDPGLRLTSRMADYERITVIRALIANTQATEHKIKQGDPLYSEPLANWLDPELLRIGERSFQAGANNIRMAGRLCLWENWFAVENALQTGYHAIIAPDNHRGAQSLLIQHYKRKGISQPNKLIDPTPDVYLFGSLCGGTCGGMMFDLAYYFRSILRVGGQTGAGAATGTAISKLYGIFTIYDSGQATNPNNRVRAANCYGSLWEHNFYSHKDTNYSVTFPDGRVVRGIKDPPFDYTMLVSRSGTDPTVQFNTPNGEFDEEGLNQMVALDLFADSAGDTGGQKNSIRTDWFGHAGYRELKLVPTGQTAKMVRCFASFGLTAVWYPKYRIATASACLIGQRLCEAWLRPCADPHTIQQDAQKSWESILEEHIDKLTSPTGESSIREDLKGLLDQARRQLERSTSSGTLEQAIRRFPGDSDGSISDRLNPGGKYCKIIEEHRSICQEALRRSVRECLQNRVNQIDFRGQYSLGDARHFLKALDNEIQGFIKQCPARQPSLDLGSLDFAPMRRAEDNWWLGAIALQDDSIQQHKKHLINEYCQLAQRAYTSTRNHFLRSILEEIRRELGVELQADDAEAREQRSTIQQQLESIDASLHECIRLFDRDYHDAIEPPKQINVEIVANNPDNQIDIDGRRVSGKVDIGNVIRELLNGRPMFEFLNSSQESIFVQTREIFRRHSLGQIDQFQVASTAQQMLNSSLENPVARLARRSNPYQTFDALYVPFTLPTPPTLICGYARNEQTLADVQNILAGQGHSFARTNPSTVEHLLFFYREEGAFALDDLAAFNMLSRRFEERPGPYGHLTHQDSTFYDIEFSIRKQLLERWMKALWTLIPAICEHYPQAFTGGFDMDSDESDTNLGASPYRFDVDDEGFYYEYTIGDELPDRVYVQDDPIGLERLARSENIVGYQWFLYLIRLNFEKIGRNNIQRLILQRVLGGLSGDEFIKTRDRYTTFLEEVYSSSILGPPPSSSASGGRARARRTPSQGTFDDGNAHRAQHKDRRGAVRGNAQADSGTGFRTSEFGRGGFAGGRTPKERGREAAKNEGFGFSQRTPDEVDGLPSADEEEGNEDIESMGDSADAVIQFGAFSSHAHTPAPDERDSPHPVAEEDHEEMSSSEPAPVMFEQAPEMIPDEQPSDTSSLEEDVETKMEIPSDSEDDSAQDEEVEGLPPAKVAEVVKPKPKIDLDELYRQGHEDEDKDEEE